MYKVIVFSFIFLYTPLATSAKCQSSYKSISYVIKFNDNEKILSVNAKYHGDFSGQQVIDLPYKWGNKNYSDQVRNVHPANEKSSFIINKDNQNQLIIKLTEPTDMIEVDYNIYPQKSVKPFDIKDLVLYDDLIHTPGHTLLAVPENIENAEKLNISIIWQVPEKWKATSSFGSGNHVAFQATAHQLQNSIYIVGKTRRYKSFIKGKTVNFSFYGNFDFSDKEIIKNTTKIIKSQRDFFNDYEFNDYLVSVIENPDGDDKTALMGGIALHNSFVVHLTRNITPIEFKILLAHEHFHNWLGNQILNSEEGLNYWWSEGFTDYYARILSFREGIITLKEFVKDINNILGEYHESPVKELNNTEININFWRNPDIYRLPYLRGFMFALGLNCKLKSIKPNLSTDIIVKYFQQNHEKVVFSNENFIEALKAKNIYTKDIDQYFNNHIIKGQGLSLDNCLCYLQLEPTLLDSAKKMKGSFSINFH